MKTYKEMADEVFRIGDERIAEKQMKNKRIKRAVISVSGCAAAFALVFGFWESGILTGPKAGGETKDGGNETFAATSQSEESTSQAITWIDSETENNVGNVLTTEPIRSTDGNGISTGVTSNTEMTAPGGLSGGNPGDNYGGTMGWFCVPAFPFTPGIEYTGERLTDDDAKAYFEKDGKSIISSLSSSGVPADNIRIAEKGYSHACFDGVEGKPLEVRLNYRDYLVYNGKSLVAIITLYKENGEIYSSPAFGAAWFEDYNSFLNSHKGQELVFLYAGSMEVVATPDGKLFSPLGYNTTQYFENSADKIYEASYCSEIVYVP